MPAKSRKQRITAAIAKHSPEKLYKRNIGMLSMSKKQLGEFARKKAIDGARHNSHKKGY